MGGVTNVFTIHLEGNINVRTIPRTLMLALLKTAFHNNTDWTFSFGQNSSVVVRSRALTTSSRTFLNSKNSFTCDSEKPKHYADYISFSQASMTRRLSDTEG